VKKRSAMAMAAGLVAALLAGSAALSVGLTAPNTAQAGSGEPEPIVRTIQETVTVHRKANEAGAVSVIAAPATLPASSTSSGDSFDESIYEDGEHEDDDSYEDDEHEDD